MNTTEKSPLSIVETRQPEYSQITTHIDDRYQAAWYFMHSSPRPCFTPQILDEIQRFHQEVTAEIDDGNRHDIQFMVLASNIPGIFNLGGDLNLIHTLVKRQDRRKLFGYAKACIDALYGNINNLSRDITTISLVQGDALGGGLEAALSSDILIAERSTKLGFPEILFNLFPGMGAYSLLSRKIGAAKAERMILSGRIYTAEELFEMSIVDVLAEDLQGEMAVYDYIKKESRSSNGYRALRAAKNCVNPITREELMKVTQIWVDAALRLNHRDLRMMERLVSRQSTQEKNQRIER